MAPYSYLCLNVRSYCENKQLFVAVSPATFSTCPMCFTREVPEIVGLKLSMLYRVTRLPCRAESVHISTILCDALNIIANFKKSEFQVRKITLSADKLKKITRRVLGGGGLGIHISSSDQWRWWRVRVRYMMAHLLTLPKLPPTEAHLPTPDERIQFFYANHTTSQAWHVRLLEMFTR